MSDSESGTSDSGSENHEGYSANGRRNSDKLVGKV
jgi:hypothetical protein